MPHAKIDALIQSLPFLCQSEWKRERLDGWSNTTYLLSNTENQYVVRIPQTHLPNTISAINRQREYNQVKQLENKLITPDTVYFDPDTGICIREFVPGSVISDDPEKITPQDLSGIADVLYRLHHLPIQFESLSILQILQEDFSSIQAKFKNLDSRYFKLQDYAATVKKQLNNTVSKPCHMDPHPHNLLKTDKNILLLDFEYAFASDPAWDLAYVITYANLSELQTRYFLQAYPASFELRQRINLYAPLTQWMQAIWIRLQFLIHNYPVPEAEMLCWENNALEKACNLL